MEQHMESVLKEKKGTKGEYRTLSKWLCLVFPADEASRIKKESLSVKPASV